MTETEKKERLDHLVYGGNGLAHIHVRTFDHEPTNPLCHHCGKECSGETVETVVIYDDITAEKPVCAHGCQ